MATGFVRTVPVTGWCPRRTPSPMTSGPAHSTDSMPPSAASARTAPPRAVAASSRSTRYRPDLPEPLAPVTTVSRPSGTTRSRSDRYPSTAIVSSTGRP